MEFSSWFPYPRCSEMVTLQTMLEDAQNDPMGPAKEDSILLFSLHHQSCLQWQVKWASRGSAALCTLMPFWIIFGSALPLREAVKSCPDYGLCCLDTRAAKQCPTVFAGFALCRINPWKHTAGYTWHSRTVVWSECEKQSSDEDPSICCISFIKLPKGFSSSIANLVVSQMWQKPRQHCLGLTKQAHTW